MAAITQPLKFLVVQPVKKHTSTIIFMHGLGDTGHGWEPVASMLAPDFPNTKWILPHARILPVSLNMGMKMSSWFDIASLSDMEDEDEKGLLSAAKDINEILTAEVDSGIPASQIIIGGFSQGCAVGLLTGLTTERKLAGIVALSGWLPLRSKMKAMIADHARTLPVFWGHGTQDPVVDFSFGERSVRVLREELKFKGVTFEKYRMGHTSSPEELRDLTRWLKAVVPAEEP